MKSEFKDGAVLIDGKPIQIRSGAMHYFRIRPELWKARLKILRQCGLNTVETYLAWNVHEKAEGQWNFSGALDFAAYIKAAADEGLMVIVRPGPYMCSEWDLGGMPAWLLKNPSIRLRTSDPDFLIPCQRYLAEVLRHLVPLQCSCGGPIIAMQLENEYGSFGQDKKYLLALKKCFDEAGVTVPLFTSDGAPSPYLEAGTLPNLTPAVNGRNKPGEMIALQQNFRPGAVPFIMELWDGTSFHWGEYAGDHKAEYLSLDIRELMEKKINFNLYMFHGGTNFGFMNGANSAECYQPLITSYDVDGVLPEDGTPGEKYDTVQHEIYRALGCIPEKPEKPLTQAYGRISLDEYVSLEDSLETLSKAVISDYPLRMEELDSPYGFVLYRHCFKKGRVFSLSIKDLRDRAILLVNGKLSACMYRNDASNTKAIPIPDDGVLDILVENMGRINFGAEMNFERKGIRSLLDDTNREICGFENYPLALDDISGLKFKAGSGIVNTPAFFRGIFNADSVHDTFFRIPGGVKGVVFLNGFNLGRYWNIGPQYTLYVPAPLIRKGKNEIVVFELEHLGVRELLSENAPDFGPRVEIPL